MTKARDDSDLEAWGSAKLCQVFEGRLKGGIPRKQEE